MAAAPAQQRHIDIPVKGSVDVVEVDIDELPEQAADIIEILREEESPRLLYLRFAVEYYRKGDYVAFQELLEQGLVDVPFMEAHDIANPSHKIALYNCLAAFTTQRASALHDMDEKASLLDKTTAFYNQSDRINIHDVSTWLGKGVLLLAKGSWDSAAQQFKMVINGQKDSVPALLGMAQVHFHRKQYKEALKLYQRVFKLAPRSKPDARIGIGLCMAALGDWERARVAFERVVQSDSGNVAVMAMLAIVYFNLARVDTKSAEARAYVQLAVQLLKRGQQLDKEHPAIISQLADILFQRSDFEKCTKFVEQALTRTQSPSTKALLFFYTGRLYHVQGNFVEALQYYSRANQLDAENTLTLYCLAQVLLERNDRDSARTHLEAALKIDADNADVTRLLAFIYATIADKEADAVDMLRKVVANDAADIDALVELARLLETRDQPEAIKVYQQVNTAMVSKGQVSLQMLNNLGVLLLSAGDLEGAEKTLQKAYQICVDNKTELASMRPTLMYNLGRLMELMASTSASGDHGSKAAAMYKELLAVDPGYVDATLRLGYLSQSTGKFDEAAERFKEVVGADENCIDGWISLGNLDLERRAYKASRGSFERVLKKIDSHDVYCLAASGNDRLLSAQSDPKLDSKHNQCKEALKFFDKCLRMDPNNPYAANGIAVALAEMGRTTEARDVLSKLRDACPQLLHPQVNFAHTMVELGQYHAAIALYTAMNRKFGDDKDVQYLLFSARAYYILARTEKSPDDMLSCIVYLEKACHYVPRDLTLVFNLALAMQQFAQLVCDKPAEQRTVVELRKAQSYVSEAQRMFGSLKDAKATEQSTERLGYDPSLAAQREKHCDYVSSTVTRRLTQQLANEEIQREKMDELKRRREKELLAKQAQVEEEERKKRELQEKLARERQAIYDMLQTDRREQIAKVEAPPQKKRKRARDKDVSAVDAEDPVAEEEEAVVGGDEVVLDDNKEKKQASSSKKKLTRPRAAALSEDVVESSSDEEGADHAASAPRGTAMIIADDMDD